MRAALILSLAATLLVAPARAAEGPAPPSAPTPDEAAAARSDVPSSGQPATDQGKADQGKTGSADATAEAVRKAQENGSYKTKDGGMYQPPETRPAPLWNEGYGRT